MTEITADDLLNCINTNDMEDFVKKISVFCNTGYLMEFIDKCNDEQIRVAVDWYKKDNNYLIHKIFERIEDVDSIRFLKTFSYYDKLDSESRTLLHIAVINDRSIEILKFLIEVKGISIESEDDYAYTPLHYYCQKEEYDSQVLKLLMKNQNQLTQKSKDGLTPLEFACSNQENLQKIRDMNSVDMKQLLKTIDNIAHGVTEVERYSLTKSFSTDRIWLNLLQKNDKYMVLSYIKHDKDFASKYYLEPKQILSIIKKCPENGQGILSFVKVRFFKGPNEPKLFKILSDLTGITITERIRNRTFYKSALFLALLTGRFQLISPLLRCCQFEIVSHAMLICLICNKLVARKQFPDQVIRDILDLKDFCEEYSIATTNQTYNRDLSEDKAVIGSYINRKSDKLYQKSILDIAYHADCIKYLGTPTCQESLTRVWTKRSSNCPQIKFWLHSIVHLAFLMLFAFVVVNNLFSKVSLAEVLCYVYGLGYCVEEVRQLYLMTQDDFFQSYAADPTNIIDICALFFMFVAFILRVSLHNPVSTEIGDEKLFEESRHPHLFAQRLLLCLSLISFFMRVLYFASLNETLGPKLKMISTMITKDLIPILFLFNIFVTSFGITFQSLLFPNSFYTQKAILGGNRTFYRKSSINTVSDIFRRATFTIFNFHYTLDEIEANRNNYVTDSNGCYAVYFLLLIFMLVVNVMLMNLLIAQFSNTVTRIIIESKQSWKSGRYGFIHEYSDRTIAPPPFNMIMIPIEVIVWFARKRSLQSNKKLYVHDDQTDASIHLVGLENEIPEEPSMSYYIYQAFAMSGQRYRLLKDGKDFEYEKEIHFKNIEEKLKVDKVDLKRTINERCSGIEGAIKSQAIKKSYNSISTTVSF